MLTYPAHLLHRTSGLDWLIKGSHLNSLFYDYIFKQVEPNAQRSKLYNDSIIKLQYIASIYNTSVKLCTQDCQGFNMWVTTFYNYRNKKWFNTSTTSLHFPIFLCKYAGIFMTVGTGFQIAIMIAQLLHAIAWCYGSIQWKSTKTHEEHVTVRLSRLGSKKKEKKPVFSNREKGEEQGQQQVFRAHWPRRYTTTSTQTKHYFHDSQTKHFKSNLYLLLCISNHASCSC